MITLWGRLNSLNVQKVAWCLDELGVRHQRIEAGREHGVVGTPEYRAMNPNALVPTIKDGDLVLWESNAIVRYLCAKYSEKGDKGFWPADPAMRASGDRWMDWQQTSFNKAISAAFMNLIRTPADRRDMAAVEASRIATEKQVAILDQALAKSEWIGGEAFGMAEFAIGPQAHRWLHLPLAREARPNLERWYAAFMRRPAAQRYLTLPLT